MKRHQFGAITIAAFCVLALGSAVYAQDDRTQSSQQQTTPTPPSTVQPEAQAAHDASIIEVPSGTAIRVRMIDHVDSGLNHAGQLFHASLDEPIKVNDAIVIPAGADVTLRLIAATQAEPVGGTPELRLKLVRIQVQGRPYTLVAEEYSTKGNSRGKKIGEGAIAGAIIGGGLGTIADGAAGGVALGAAGAATGAGIASSTRPKQVTIPSETKLEFTLELPLKIPATPKQP
ncbi:MAG TPA: hypothetical protein VFO34_08935 [Candidatus Acidoferrales bacterium]|nr:hypothetical protein [Candidatus Acidoferrales bacterium]